jgi:alpha-galactosidase
MDSMGARVHEWLRARPTHPQGPRPVTLNTWEAVYFAQSPQARRDLADVAADVGVERFVLDDGWFGARRDDTAGLGDWTPSADVWPDGLAPLVAHVTGLGMQFGLWIEPEMVNVDSGLYREHPDWVLAPPRRLPPEWRHQQVLDLANPDVSAHLLGRLDSLLAELDIAALKWDHNRDLIEAIHDGRPGVHAQTVALYRLLDKLRVRHPGVEIESCSSGGGRVDLEILARTDRVWPSDSNDALERASIQYWTSLLIPPELIGTHVGPPTSHTTGRTHQLDFRAVVALFGHAGIEWDLRDLDAGEREHLRGWVALHRELRGLLHSGRVVRADLADPAALLHGVVASDATDAVFAYVALGSSADTVPPPVRLPGLDPARRYRVAVELRAGPPWTSHALPPPWTHDGVTLPGSVLGSVGLPLPLVMPEHALLLRVSDTTDDAQGDADGDADTSRDGP